MSRHVTSHQATYVSHIVREFDAGVHQAAEAKLTDDDAI
jgi:hypothetical protein